MPTTVRGTIMQVPSAGRLEVRRDVVVTVDDDGTIASIVDARDAPGAAGEASSVDVALGASTVVLPGLVDTHVHAPQWPQLGTGLDLDLETWLLRRTFPLEARLTDPAFAAVVWPAMVDTLLAHGTTTAAYYATIDVETTTMLASTCARAGQRALVGRVAMDHPTGTPEWYRDHGATASVDASARSVEEIRALGSDLVRPIITPRFAPACTDAAMAGLGELAEATGATVQTHCSESDWEHGHALDRFGVSDAIALERFGLVRDRSVLAHGDHLGRDDLGLLRARGAGVAHCPLSNAHFANAVFPARRALDAGVGVGLGTDVAGGPDPSLLRQCAHAVTVSQMLTDGVDAGLDPHRRGVPGSRLSILEAFHLATVGGAELLGLDVGLLEVGRPFDAIAVDTERDGSALRRWPEIDDDERTFEKIVRLATPADITHVWTSGVRRHPGGAHPGRPRPAR
ncbi:amidohydrolase family protein [Ilumatobacter sp.]|uniref:amidohydrolase family protein n=1 Tax=Ilumatobacter sp. TaxID=1967498 RepID=UPI003B51ECA9